jgi:hypothetical protein
MGEAARELSQGAGRKSMLPAMTRRAAALGFALSLVVPGLAAADTVAADGDAVTAGDQVFVDLGIVAPGAVLTVGADLRLTCHNAVHAAAGSVIRVDASSITSPEGGALAVAPGRITVPSTWPASGDGCPDGLEPVTGDIPALLTVTAPMAPAPDLSYTVLFALDPADGVTNLVAFSVTLEVGVTAPADTVPPVLSGVPGPLSAWTGGDAAAIAWASPTAADDMDPDPVVACDPSSGSTFPVGTSTVTCSATDAAGNASTASFDVTVSHVDAEWGRPLGRDEVVVHAGRTLPVVLALLAAGGPLGPDGLQAPTLLVTALDGCGAGAAAGAAVDAGVMTWADGHWELRLDTGGWHAGCVRITALVHGDQVAATTVRVIARDHADLLRR